MSGQYELWAILIFSCVVSITQIIIGMIDKFSTLQHETAKKIISILNILHIIIGCIFFAFAIMHQNNSKNFLIGMIMMFVMFIVSVIYFYFHNFTSKLGAAILVIINAIWIIAIELRVVTKT